MKCIICKISDKCLMCGSETIAKEINEEIHVYSDCLYNLQNDIKGTIDKIDKYLAAARKNLEAMK